MPISSTTTLTQEVQDAIAAELLIQPDDVYEFFETGPIQKPDAEVSEKGTTTLIFNRPTLPTGTYTEASRRLTDGTNIDLTGIAIAMTQASLTTREYAGPHDGTRITPFIYTEFLRNRAKHSPAELIGAFLRRDLFKFRDTAVRDLLLAAPQVYTPNGVAEATITAGQAMSVAFLRALNKAMKDLKIPRYANGNWRLHINTRDESNLKGDTEYREAYRYFAGSNPAFRGHAMTFEGFDLIVHTTLPTKAVGAGGAVTGFQGCAHGPFGLGWGVSLNPHPRVADETDFGRKESVIWKSEEAIGTLYSDLLVRTVTT